MAAPCRTTDHSVAETLFDEPYRFDFFQAVRLLERMYAGRGPVGRYADPAREAVRFHARASLTFPASEIFELSDNGDGTRGPQMTVAFMGLSGPLGVLPYHYTELLMERARYKDRALSEFLDIFNHRIISLFYRAWQKYRFPVAYERGEDDRFSEYLYSVIGFGTRGLRQRLALPDEGLLLYGGLIAQRPRSAAAIESILSDYFQAPIKAAQFTGQWLDLDDASITRMGKMNSRLGIDCVVGTRVWDSQSKFRMIAGPLTFNRFQGLLPTAGGYAAIGDLTRVLVGLELDYELQLVLKAEEVPACTLTSAGGRQARLGWTSWLKTRPFKQDDGQVVLQIKNPPPTRHES